MSDIMHSEMTKVWQKLFKCRETLESVENKIHDLITVYEKIASAYPTAENAVMRSKVVEALTEVLTVVTKRREE